MTTYATYRHIELDNVGYGKKRVHNPSSEIFNVLCTPPSKNSSMSNGSSTPRRHSHGDSFTRLFGNETSTSTPSRKSSIVKRDSPNRNPVTGNGVTSWDQKRGNTPKVHTERNPVTGEVYTIVSPATTPTKIQNGFAFKKVKNGGESTPIQNGHIESPAEKPLTNGQA